MLKTIEEIKKNVQIVKRDEQGRPTYRKDNRGYEWRYTYGLESYVIHTQFPDGFEALSEYTYMGECLFYRDSEGREYRGKEK